MRFGRKNPAVCPQAPNAQGDEDVREEGAGAFQGGDSSYWRGTSSISPSSSESAESDQFTDVGATPREIRQIYAVKAVYQRDHIAAGLLAIFLGMFGVHKFYLGYNRTAFIMMAVSIIGSIVTLGLAGAVIWLIAIIEGIIYLSKSQSDFDCIYVLGERDWF